MSASHTNARWLSAFARKLELPGCCVVVRTMVSADSRGDVTPAALKQMSLSTAALVLEESCVKTGAFMPEDVAQTSSAML